MFIAKLVTWHPFKPWNRSGWGETTSNSNIFMILESGWKEEKEATEYHLKYLRAADPNCKPQKSLENQLRTAFETERGPPGWVQDSWTLKTDFLGLLPSPTLGKCTPSPLAIKPDEDNIDEEKRRPRPHRWRKEKVSHLVFDSAQKQRKRELYDVRKNFWTPCPTLACYSKIPGTGWLIAHSSGGWKAEVRVLPAQGHPPGCRLLAESSGSGMGRDFCHLFTGPLITGAEPSRPNYLPKAIPPDTPELGFRMSAYKMGVGEQEYAVYNVLLYSRSQEDGFHWKVSN